MFDGERARFMKTGEGSSVKGKPISNSKKRLMKYKRDVTRRKIKKLTTQLGHMSTGKSTLKKKCNKNLLINCFYSDEGTSAK
jgi:hypothetical protein